MVKSFWLVFKTFKHRKYERAVRRHKINPNLKGCNKEIPLRQLKWEGADGADSGRVVRFERHERAPGLTDLGGVAVRCPFGPRGGTDGTDGLFSPQTRQKAESAV